MMAVVVMMTGVVGTTVIDGRGMVDNGRRRVNDRSWGVDDGRGLIDDRWLDHDGLRGLGVNDGGAGLLHDDLFYGLPHDDRCGLVNNRSGINVNRRC